MDATESRTPQVRGRDGASENGSGVSPKAKRPAIMVQPDVIPTAETTMTLQELTAIVKNLDARAEARLTWTKSIAEAVEDHADQLEACSREILVTRTKLNEFQTTVQAGTANAEGKIGELFMKSDALFEKNKELFAKTDKVLVDLEAADAALKALLEARIHRLSTPCTPCLGRRRVSRMRRLDCSSRKSRTSRSASC